MKLPRLFAAFLALAAFSSQARAIDLPGSDLWTGLLLGEIDTNGDGIVDSGEWQGAVERAFAALDEAEIKGLPAVLLAWTLKPGE